MIPIVQVVSDESRIRRSMCRLDGLKSTISDAGLLQPILVRKNGNATYTVIDGERRLQALKGLGVPELIVGRDVVIDVEETDADVRFKQIIANIQQESLNPIELAYAFVTLKKMYGYKYDEIAEIVGKTGHYVNAKVGLAKRLDPVVQEMYCQDLEGEKDIQNTFSGEPEEIALYTINLNVLEDIARLPQEAQKEAYEIIRDQEMSKAKALQFLRTMKKALKDAELASASSEILRETARAESRVPEYQEPVEADESRLRLQVRKMSRDLEKLAIAYQIGEIQPDKEVIREIEAMIEKLNQLYNQMKTAGSSIEHRASIGNIT